VFVLIVMFVPGGIVPGLQRLAARVRARVPRVGADAALAADPMALEKAQ
jgi:branched-chain amino acid transport system permease protein